MWVSKKVLETTDAEVKTFEEAFETVGDKSFTSNEAKNYGEAIRILEAFLDFFDQSDTNFAFSFSLGLGAESSMEKFASSFTDEMLFSQNIVCLYNKIVCKDNLHHSYLDFRRNLNEDNWILQKTLKSRWDDKAKHIRKSISQSLEIDSENVNSPAINIDPSSLKKSLSGLEFQPKYIVGCHLSSYVDYSSNYRSDRSVIKLLHAIKNQIVESYVADSNFPVFILKLGYVSLAGNELLIDEKDFQSIKNSANNSPVGSIQAMDYLPDDDEGWMKGVVKVGGSHREALYHKHSDTPSEFPAVLESVKDNWEWIEVH